MSSFNLLLLVLAIPGKAILSLAVTIDRQRSFFLNDAGLLDVVAHFALALLARLRCLIVALSAVHVFFLVEEQLLLLVARLGGLACLDHEYLGLVRVLFHAPHVPAVVQERALTMRVVSSLHGFHNRGAKVVLTHEGLSSLRLQVGGGARLLDHLGLREPLTRGFIQAEVAQLDCCQKPNRI